MDFAGLGFYPEELRYYPQGPVAAQVLGYAGLDNKGLEGLERSLEGTLAGKPGSQTIVKDPFGRALDVVETKPETPGKSVRLTIDQQIQANAEEVLQETVRRWGARAATAVVMDPYSGAVLAMATAPASTPTVSRPRVPTAGATVPSPTRTSLARRSSSLRSRLRSRTRS